MLQINIKQLMILANIPTQISPPATNIALTLQKLDRANGTTNNKDQS
jgi:hypothetical protein